MEEVAQLQAFDESNTRPWWMAGGPFLSPFNHHPCQVYCTPKHMSKQKRYHRKCDFLSPLLSHSLLSFLVGICFCLPVLFVFFLTFSLLSSLSKTFEATSKSAMMGPDSNLLSETELWPVVLLEAACLNFGHAALWCAIVLLCDIWFSFYKVVLHFMRPNLIFHRTTPDDVWVPRWTTPCHLLKSSSPWKGTHSEEIYLNKSCPVQKTIPQTL